VCMCVWFFVIFRQLHVCNEFTCGAQSTAWTWTHAANNSPSAPHLLHINGVNNDPCDRNLADKYGLYLQYPSACPLARFGSPAGDLSHFEWFMILQNIIIRTHSDTIFYQGLVCWNHEAGLKVLMESIWRRMERHDEQLLLFVLPSFRYMMQS
jgi:hypothetical protein